MALVLVLSSLLAQEPTLEQAVECLEKRQEGLRHLSVRVAERSESPWRGSVDGILLLVPGKLLILDSYQLWPHSAIFHTVAYAEDAWANRQSGAGSRQHYDSPAQGQVFGLPLAATLYPRAILGSLKNATVRRADDGLLIVRGGPPENVLTVRIDPARGGVTGVATAGYRTFVDEWADVAGLRLPKVVRSNIDGNGDSRITFDYTDVRRDEGPAPERPAWMDDPLINGDAPASEAKRLYGLILEGNLSDPEVQIRRLLELAPDSLVARELAASRLSGDDAKFLTASEPAGAYLASARVGVHLAAGDVEGARAVVARWKADPVFAHAALPLETVLEAKRLAPAEFVRWFAGATRSVPDALYAIGSIASSPPKANAAGASPAVEPPDDDFFKALAGLELPPALEVAVARRLQQPERLVKAAADPSWRAELMTDILAMAQEEEGCGPLTLMAIETGHVGLKVLERYIEDRYTAGDGEAVLKAAGTYAKTLTDPTHSSTMGNMIRWAGFLGDGSDFQQHNARLRNILQMMSDKGHAEAARGLVEAALPPWYGTNDGLVPEVRKLLGDNTMALFRFARTRAQEGYPGSQFEDYGLDRPVVLKLLEAEEKAGTLRADDFSLVRQWLTQGPLPEGWVPLLQRFAERRGGDSAAYELWGDAMQVGGDPSAALAAYDEAIRRGGTVDPFAEEAPDPYSSLIFFSGIMELQDPEAFSPQNPLVLKAAMAAHAAGEQARGIEILGRVPVEQTGRTLMARAYERLGAEDQAIRLYAHELMKPSAVPAGQQLAIDWSDSGFLQTNPDAGQRLCELLKRRERWEELYLAATLWLSSLEAGQASTHREIFLFDPGDAVPPDAAPKAYRDEAASHLPPDPFVERFIAEAPTEKHAEAVELAGRLGSDDVAVRDEATEKLRAIGPPAARALAPCLKSTDPEVVSRARSLLEVWAFDHFSRKRFGTP